MVGCKLRIEMLPSFNDNCQVRQLQLSGCCYLQVSCSLYRYMKKYMPISQLFPTQIYRWIIHVVDIDEILLFTEFWENTTTNFFGIIIHSSSLMNEDYGTVQGVIRSLRQKGIRVFVENELLASTRNIEDLLHNLKNGEFCYDIAHDLLSDSKFFNNSYLMSRTGIIHLHGIINRKCHYIPDDNLINIAIFCSIIKDVPIIVEGKAPLDLQIRLMQEIIQRRLSLTMI